MNIKIYISLRTIGLLFIMFSCGGNNTDSYVDSPGREKTSKTDALETGADLLQGKTPLKKINMYLEGFHFYNGHLNAQMEAHHYCSKINEDLTQCIMYDGNGEDAKIMGIEYMVSERIFKTFPAEEKKLWHSHAYEVKSGQLIAPGIPEAAEHELMEEIVSTYGKIFHTWHTDRNLELPYGIPMLMMGFTKDGQLKDSIREARDKRFGISTSEKRENRKDIPFPKIIPGADSWEKGPAWQLELNKNSHRYSHQ
jgi:hypothetical protein